MFRTKRRLKDLDFGLDIFALVLSALLECFTENEFDQARVLLNFAENQILGRMNDDNIYHSKGDPTEEQVAKFNKCSAQLFWFRIFMRYQDRKFEETSELLGSIKDQAVELDSPQSEGLSQVCHNVSLELIEKELFQEAIVWLKFTYSFGKYYFNINQ